MKYNNKSVHFLLLALYLDSCNVDRGEILQRGKSHTFWEVFVLN